VLALAVPCIAANTSTCLMVVTDQMFVGHLGVNEFAAAALANTVRCVQTAAALSHATTCEIND
jgi:Na+-driven multidrug efflux pump